MQKVNNAPSLLKLLKIEFVLLFIAIISNLLYTIFSATRSISFAFIPVQFVVYINIVFIFITFILSLSVLSTLLSLSRAEKSEKDEKESLIRSMKAEIEKQDKQISNLLSRYNNILEYDSYKTEFFSNISHELKTPLTVILGAIQLIDQKKSKMPDERRKPNKHLDTIKHNCYRLLRLVNNILDISRIDSGYIKLNMVNVNIVYLIEEIAQSVVPYAEQKGLRLEFDTYEEEIITAVDIDKIERIILNLLSNAIKFTPSSGKIRVNVRKKSDKVIIIVRDNGPGIPENKKNIVFERFKQANTSLTRENEGSGIGLSLVKSFIELHSGSIALNSEESKGTEFIIELPLKLCDTCKDSYDPANSRQNRIIEAINIEFSDIYSAA